MYSRTLERNLRFIAAFEFLKGLLLLVLACGTLGFLHRDVREIAEHWIKMLHFDPDGRYAGALLAKLGLVDDKKIKELSAISFVYSAIHFTEAAGLWLNRKWGKYFTIIITASFIPLEIYSIFEHFRLIKLLLLVVNLAIAWFLIVLLRREKHSSYYYRPTVLFQ